MDLVEHQAELIGALKSKGFHLYDSAAGHVDFPCVIVGFPSQILYHAAIGDRLTAKQRITIAVSMTKGAAAAAQDLLRYVSRTETMDVIGALEGIGGTRVENTGEARDIEIGNVTAFGVDLFLDLSRK